MEVALDVADRPSRESDMGTQADRAEGPYLHFHIGTVWTGSAARRFDEEFPDARKRSCPYRTHDSWHSTSGDCGLQAPMRNRL